MEREWSRRSVLSGLATAAVSATLAERYEPAHGQLRRFTRLSAAERIRLVLEKWGGRALDKEKDLVGLGTNIEKLLGVSFADLAAYYATENDRRGIRDRLSSVLARHRDKKILLIAHSMGSIIAYDVLREHERSNPVTVQHLVTIGSPLGLPIVTFHVRREFGGTVTPAGVRQWS